MVFPAVNTEKKIEKIRHVVIDVKDNDNHLKNIIEISADSEEIIIIIFITRGLWCANYL